MNPSDYFYPAPRVRFGGPISFNMKTVPVTPPSPAVVARTVAMNALDAAVHAAAAEAATLRDATIKKLQADAGDLGAFRDENRKLKAELAAVRSNCATDVALTRLELEAEKRKSGERYNEGQRVGMKIREDEVDELAARMKAEIEKAAAPYALGHKAGRTAGLEEAATDVKPVLVHADRRLAELSEELAVANAEACRRYTGAAYNAYGDKQYAIGADHGTSLMRPEIDGLKAKIATLEAAASVKANMSHAELIGLLASVAQNEILMGSSVLRGEVEAGLLQLLRTAKSPVVEVRI